MTISPYETVLALVAAIAVSFWATSSSERPGRTSPAASHRHSSLFETKTPSSVRSPAERLADAFEVATGHRAAFTRTEAGDSVTTRPVRIIELPFGPALLTTREIKDGCHACTGAIGVFYLKESGDRTQVMGRWPKAVEGWGWGAPPTDWYATDKFTTYPAIYAEGGYTGQGITCGGATITELRPEGPVESEVIRTFFSNEGAVTDERIAAGEKVENLEGRIANIRKNTSFEVRVTGTGRFTEKYARRGGKFVPLSESRLGC